MSTSLDAAVAGGVRYADDLFVWNWLGHVTRQVKVQPEWTSDQSGYYLADWVVGRCEGDRSEAIFIGRSSGEIGVHQRRVDLAAAGLDLGPHAAFCRGEMPAAVYADWLEENGVGLPEAAFRVLRWRVDHGSS